MKLFKKGLNFIIKRGSPGRIRHRIGEYIPFKCDDENSIDPDFCVRLEKIYICRLADIPEEVLKHNYDGRRTKKDVINQFKKWNSDLKDKKDEEIEQMAITCIGFYVYKRY